MVLREEKPWRKAAFIDSRTIIVYRKYAMMDRCAHIIMYF